MASGRVSIPLKLLQTVSNVHKIPKKKTKRKKEICADKKEVTTFHTFRVSMHSTLKKRHRRERGCCYLLTRASAALPPFKKKRMSPPFLIQRPGLLEYVACCLCFFRVCVCVCDGRRHSPLSRSSQQHLVGNAINIHTRLPEERGSPLLHTPPQPQKQNKT